MTHVHHGARLGRGRRRRLDRRGGGARSDPHRRLVDRLSVRHRGRRAVRHQVRVPDAGGREHRHGRRPQAVLRAASASSIPTSPTPRAASRRSEVEPCAANGVEEITEVKIGYDGIVLANSKDSRADERHHRRRSGRRSPRKCRSTARSRPTRTRTGARSTRRCPTRRSRCSARRRPRARATRSSSW